MALKRMVLQIGMGTDIRGRDYTKAAVRALRDALWHNSLSVAGALGQLFKFGIHRQIIRVSPVQLLYRPGGKEKPMLEMDPRMAKSKTADGFYGLKIGGTLAKPDPVAIVVPARIADISPANSARK